MVSAFAWHVRGPRYDPQLGKIIICIFFIVNYQVESKHRRLGRKWKMLTNLILSSFYIPKALKSAAKIMEIGSEIKI